MIRLHVVNVTVFIWSCHAAAIRKWVKNNYHVNLVENHSYQVLVAKLNVSGCICFPALM